MRAGRRVRRMSKGRWSSWVTAGALVLGTLTGWAQNPLESQDRKQQEGAQSPATSGSNTAGTFPAVLDAEKRPITAGGFVKTGPVVFRDVAEKAGLTTWHHTMGTPEKNYILETMGSGVALIDYDNDGWLDIYLVNGSTVDALAGKGASARRCSTTTMTARLRM